MNTEQNWFELIEKYNLGHLSAGQTAQFEAAMQANEALAAAVRTHRAEWEAQELLAENLLRAQIRERMADWPDDAQSPDSGRNWLVKYWKYLLPMLLLSGVLVFFMLQKPGEQPPAIQQQQEQEIPAQKGPLAPVDTVPAPAKQPVAGVKKQQDLRQLALAIYRAPEGLSGIRGQNDDDNLNLAIKAFFEKNYRRVLELLETLPEDDRQEALSLRAHARFGLSNFQAAARDFTELEAGGIYRREAQWFGLLSRMAVRGADKVSLKKELETILQTAGHPYQKEAGVLMKSAF